MLTLPTHLEERGLLWSESGALSWDEDVNWCQGAGLGGSWFLVAEQLVADLDQIGLGKDETHVVHNVGQNLEERGSGEWWECRVGIVNGFYKFKK